MAFSVVTYSVHAEERLAERSIGKNQVATTLDSPDTVVLISGNKLKATRMTSAGNLLTVVYTDRISPEGRCAHVVTVYRS